jgi:uncharacterized protein (DUF1330 family)
MSVIVLVQGNLRAGKEEVLDRYRQTARTVIARHGGEVVALGSGLGSVHGDRKWQVGIAVRFPDKGAVDAWLGDPEYKAVLPLRGDAYQDLEINVFQE